LQLARQHGIYNGVVLFFGSRKMLEMPQNLVEMALKSMGDRWKVMIIQELMDGTKRFGEIKKELGDITQKVLTANLRALEEKGILIRTVYAQIPPKVEYTLTNLGYNLKPVLDSMRQWAEEYYNQNVKNLMPNLA
jgi:DNA-binding HxlR family transcriptional regulator